MPIADPLRARRMEHRLARTLEDLGADGSTVRLLTALHAAATAPRTAAFDDDHEPSYLHPGRSALILLIDYELAEPLPLALALTHDSEGPELEPSDDAVRGALADSEADPTFADRLIASRAGLPRSGDDHLLEELLALDDRPLHAALAERLDHLRHLHLRPVDSEARRCWAEAHEVWLPLAERVGGTFARRFRWWVRKFERRYREAPETP